MKNPSLHIVLWSLLMCVTGNLTSCKLGQSYAAPELHLPAAFSEEYSDTISLADKDWTEIYTDTLLQALIRKALIYNKDLRIATARIKEMAAAKRISIANLLPQLDARITGESELENHGGDHFIRVNTYEAKTMLSWEADLWGRLQWSKDVSVAQYLGSVEAQRALQMTLVSEVAQAYYELTTLDRELAIVYHTLEARRESVRLTKLRFEGGLTAEAPYQQAQVEQARTATLIPELERKIAVKESDIALLTGSYPSTIARSTEVPSVLLTHSLPVGLPSALLERRPDLRQAEQNRRAAHAAVGVAYTNRFPRLTLTGEYGLESVELANFLKSPYALTHGTLLGPIFGWGKHKAAYKAQQAAYEQEEYRYEKAVLTAFKETSNAIVNFNKKREIYESMGKLEILAKDYLELARLQYLNGTTTYLDVLDAQRGLLNAQIASSNALRDAETEVVQLYKTLGGGWTSGEGWNKEAQDTSSSRPAD